MPVTLRLTLVSNVSFALIMRSKRPKFKIRTTPIRYAPAEQRTSDSATAVTTSLRRGADLSSSDPTIISGKRQSSQEDPDRDAQKHPRRTCSPGGSILSSHKLDDRDTHATSPDAGVDGDDDASEEASPHESGGSCSSSSAGGDQCIGASAR